MDLEEYLHKDEETDIHQTFTEEEIVESFKPCEESDSDEPEELVVQPEFSLEEKIKALQICISMLDDNAYENVSEIKKLRRLLSELIRQDTLERLSRLKQSDIRAYF